MAIFNRRYALLGWAVFHVVKRVVRRKVKSAIRGRGGSRRLTAAGFASSVAALGGALWFLRRRTRDGGDGPGE